MFLSKGHGKRDSLDQEQNETQSTWLVAPYFFLYFMMFTINTMMWPLMLLERSCVHFLHIDVSFTRFKGDFLPSNSCVATYFQNLTASSGGYLQQNQANNAVLNLMIICAFGSGLVSLLSYFCLWKPMITRCRGFSLLLPPVCTVCQSILLSYAQGIEDFDTFKYTVLSSTLLPSLHCNIQGVILLLYRMSQVPDVKTRKEILNVRLDSSHGSLCVAMMFGGLFVSGCFDLTYTLMSFMQFALGCVNILYAFALMSDNESCISDVVNEKKEKEESSDEFTSSEEEEEVLIGAMAKNRRDGGLLSKGSNAFSDAPMIFSEVAYRKELIVIIEVTVFSIAMLADTALSGPYLIQPPLSFDFTVFGYCIAAQGFIRLIGMIGFKIISRFSPFKHGSLMCIASINYITYYVALSLASSKMILVAVMFVNLFSGLAFPTLFSFVKLNLEETSESVVELSMLSSLFGVMCFNAAEYYIFEKTRTVFPGAIFVFTASIIALSIIVILATYLSTTVKNKRRTKYFADKLLNDDY